jgi:prepilin peptidase CpaA
MSYVFGHFIVLAILAGLFVAAAIQDALHYKLSNRITLAVTLLYPAYVLASPTPVDWLPALILAGVVLLVGFGLFVVGWAGGGDAKLLAAATLWAGVAHFPEFLLATTLFGGFLALIMITRRLIARRAALAAGHAGPPPRILGQHELPYGVAIAFGGLATVIILSGV